MDKIQSVPTLAKESSNADLPEYHGHKELFRVDQMRSDGISLHLVKDHIWTTLACNLTKSQVQSIIKHCI